mmetsp:Transcript_11428/g.70181  ORF Transcript_11428/g.70181 Transcript_11428/m.70181 type:complete len:122 (-) Transcript_11428:1300-1665(-)
MPRHDRRTCDTKDELVLENKVDGMAHPRLLVFGRNAPPRNKGECNTCHRQSLRSGRIAPWNPTMHARERSIECLSLCLRRPMCVSSPVASFTKRIERCTRSKAPGTTAGLPLRVNPSAARA